MASSARPAPSPDPFVREIVRALAHDAAPPSSARVARRLGVAFSGGADSALLLHTVAAWAELQRDVEILAFHINHGLSPHASTWTQQCRQFAAERAIPFDVRSVTLARGAGTSLEAVAREARYDALLALCAEHDCAELLTGHNATDQAETLLLNLIRGTGVAGMSGMPVSRTVSGVRIVRPFLAISAEAIRERALALGLAVIQDESNANTALTRNALRHDVMPALVRLAPDALDKLGRTAQHAREAQGLLDALGLEDLARAGVDARGFDVDVLRALSRERAANALRAWFRAYRAHAPSHAALAEMLDQLTRLPAAGRLELVHENERFTVFNGRLVASPRALVAEGGPQELCWSGEACLDIPDWHGRLCFDRENGPGVGEAWLRSRKLLLRPRQGGERLKLHAARPSRTLKNLYQEAHIGDAERDHLPLLYANEQLVFAAGLGVDVRVLAMDPEASATRVVLRWERYSSHA